MRRSPTIESPMFPDGKDWMDNRESSPETSRLSVDLDVKLSDTRIRKIQKQQSETSKKNDGPTAPGIKKMSLACMQASVERLSKNVERKISDQLMNKKMSLASMQSSTERLRSKPIIKKESKVNVNDKQIKKVPKMMSNATTKKMSLACMQASAERLSKNFDRKMSKPIKKKESKVNVNDKKIKKVPKTATTKKMSLACMQASAERLSKNFDRKMSKPIKKKESKVNVNDKKIKKVPKTATVPRRSVSEMTETRLLVPLTPENPSLKHQCIHENTVTVMPSIKDVAVQTVPLALFLQQPAEIISTDGYQPQPLPRKTLNNDASFKDIVKKFDKFQRKNMKTMILFKKYIIDNLSALRIVAAASNHDYWKYLMYFSSFSIGVITTYMLNYGWYHLQRIKITPHLLK